MTAAVVSGRIRAANTTNVTSTQTFDRGKFQQAVASLAARNVFIGTSSWKYAGWRELLYTDDRYIWRGKFSEARFERLCLSEYAEVFKTVSVDAAYYKFPDRDYLKGLVDVVPAEFRFTLKVTDDITLRHFPNLPRFGRRAGQTNEHFLNADVFNQAFLGACEPFQKNIGVIIFEFAQFHTADFARGRDFVAALDEFLAKLPKGWRYGVEIRNRHFLHPEYFAMLARHGVAHVYNSWQDMPPTMEQIEMAGSRTNPEFLAARFLLKPGRKYEEAVKLFSPYNRVQEPYPEGREAAAELIAQALAARAAVQAFIYVNNRFEGNALGSIAAILDSITAN